MSILMQEMVSFLNPDINCGYQFSWIVFLWLLDFRVLPKFANEPEENVDYCKIRIITWIYYCDFVILD